MRMGTSTALRSFISCYRSTESCQFASDATFSSPASLGRVHTHELLTQQAFGPLQPARSACCLACRLTSQHTGREPLQRIRRSASEPDLYPEYAPFPGYKISGPLPADLLLLGSRWCA